MGDLFAMSVSVNKVKGSASEWAFLELVDSSNIQGSLIGIDKNHSQKIPVFSLPVLDALPCIFSTSREPS